MNLPSTRDELLELQWRRLERQLDVVFEHSAFYRRKYGAEGIERGDIRTMDDFRKLPFTTKDELRQDQEEHAPLGSTLCVPRSKISWLPTTSGSSGVPVILPRTKQDIERWTALATRMSRMNGLREGDTYQMIMAFQWIFTGMILHNGIIQAGGTSISAGMGNTERQIWSLQHLNPRVVFATPAYFMHLASELERRGIAEKLNIEVAVSGGEIGANLPSWKAALKQRIPSIKTVCDVGGVTEIGTPIWSECSHETGAHLFEDAVLVEVLDPVTGLSAAEGEVVITDLIGEGAPIIRYQVRDIAGYTAEPCPCGSPLARFPNGVIGRTDDMLTVNSANLFPAAIEATVRETEGLSGEYQIIVRRRGALDSLIIRVERAESSNEPDADLIARLTRKLQVATAVHPTIELLAHGELPRFVYKAKRVADERKNQFADDLQAVAEAQQRM